MASITAVYVDVLPTTGKNAASNPIDGVDFPANSAKRRALSVDEAASRLELDWSKPLAHQTFYQAVFRAAVLRANRLVQIPETTGLPTSERLNDSVLPPGLTFHALRHTYASLCVAAGIPPLQLSRFMGHAHVGTTLGIYTHLFQDDHSDAMAALGAMSRTAVRHGNVIPFAR
jgi:integrase